MLDLEGAVEQWHGFAILSVADQYLGVGDQCGALEAFDLGGLFEAVEGLGELAEVGEVVGQFDQGLAVEGVALDDLGEHFNSGVRVAFIAGDLGAEGEQFEILGGLEAAANFLADAGDHVLGLAVVGGAGKDAGGAEEGLGVGRCGFSRGGEVGIQGQIGRFVVHVDVAEQGEGLQFGFAHAADDFEVLRGVEGLVVADQGVALEEPEVGVVGIVLQEGVEEGDGVAVALGLKKAAGEADLPVAGLRLHEDGLAVGGFGGVVAAAGEVGVAEEAVGAAIHFAEFHGLGDDGDGVGEVAVLHEDEAEVLVGAAEVRVLGDGAAVVGLGLGQVAFLEVEVGQDEVEGGAGAGLDLRLELLDGGLGAGLDEIDESAEGFLLIFGDLRLVAGEEAVGPEEFLDEGWVVPEVGGGVGGRQAGGGQAEAEEEGFDFVAHDHQIKRFESGI